MEKSRYLRSGVFVTLALGITVAVVSAWKCLWGECAQSWEHAGHFGMWVTGVGMLAWVCLTVPRVGSDVIGVWKKSKAVALVTLAILGLFGVKLYRFAGPHFYGWGDPEAWIFFTLAVLLVAFLLLRAALALCNAIGQLGL